MENGLGSCASGCAERAASAARGFARVANAGERWNPNQGIFSVRVTRSMSALVGIEVFDAMGRMVKVRVDNNSSGSEVTIPSALNTGLYVVRALHADGTRSQATIILQP